MHQVPQPIFYRFSKGEKRVREIYKRTNSIAKFFIWHFQNRHAQLITICIYIL